jgi:hypothetical protein
VDAGEGVGFDFVGEENLGDGFELDEGGGGGGHGWLGDEGKGGKAVNLWRRWRENTAGAVKVSEN